MAMIPNSENPLSQEFINARAATLNSRIDYLDALSKRPYTGRALDDGATVTALRALAQTVVTLNERLDDSAAIINELKRDLTLLKYDMANAQTAIEALVFEHDQPIQGGGPLMRSEDEPAYETAAQ